MEKNAPPLKVWIYVTIIISLLFYCLYYFSDSIYNQSFSNVKKNLKTAIIKNNNQDPLKIPIVFIGSSLTTCAFDNTIDLENKIFKQTKKKVTVLRVAISNLDMQTAEEISFFAYISKYPPQYLFIENNRLNIDDVNISNQEKIKQKKPKVILTALKERIKNTTYSKLGLTLENFKGFYRIMDKVNPNFYFDKFDRVIYNEMLLKKRFTRYFSQNKIANKAYCELRKKNTKIFFIDLPRASELEKNYLDKEMKFKMNKVLNEYKVEYGIGFWKYPKQMTDSCFSDGGHLNFKGSEIFENWFVNKFALQK